MFNQIAGYRFKRIIRTRPITVAVIFLTLIALPLITVYKLIDFTEYATYKLYEKEDYERGVDYSLMSEYLVNEETADFYKNILQPNPKFESDISRKHNNFQKYWSHCQTAGVITSKQACRHISELENYWFTSTVYPNFKNNNRKPKGDVSNNSFAPTEEFRNNIVKISDDSRDQIRNDIEQWDNNYDKQVWNKSIGLSILCFAEMIIIWITHCLLMEQVGKKKKPKKAEKEVATTA